MDRADDRVEWRERARMYKTLVDQRSAWVQRIHAELYLHRVTLPETSIRWAKTRDLLEDDGLRAAAWLQGGAMPPVRPRIEL